MLCPPLRCFYVYFASTAKPVWKGIDHSLDIWHKSKKIPATLGPESKKVKYRPLIPWIKHIANHFWFCCRNCKGNTMRLRDMWLSCLSHVRNVHVWMTGNCKHTDGPIEPEGKDWLVYGSPAHNLLK